MRRWIAIGTICASACFEEPGGVDPQATSGEPTSTSAGTSTGSESGTATTLASADAVSSSMPDTSSGATPMCGDGVPEGDEECDDGNEDPGDGCTACRTSLTVEWVRTFGTDLPDEVAASISGRTDQIVVAGMLGGDMGDGDLWLEVLDEAGESTHRILSGGMAGFNDAVVDVRFAADGGVWTTGTVTDDLTEQSQVDSRRYTPAFELDWVVKHGGDNVLDRGNGLGILVGGAIVGATLGNAFASDAWLVRYTAGGSLDEEFLCDCGAFGGVIDVATGIAGTRAAVTTETGRELWGFDDAIAGGPSWSADISASDQPSLAIDVGGGGDTIVCSSRAGGNDVSIWVARYDSNGDELWTLSHDLGDGDQGCLDVAVSANAIVLVGFVREDATNARGLVARLDPGTGDVVHSQELEIEGSADTRVVGIDLLGETPYVAGAYAVDDLDDDAFAARLVP